MKAKGKEKKREKEEGRHCRIPRYTRVTKQWQQAGKTVTFSTCDKDLRHFARLTVENESGMVR